MKYLIGGFLLFCTCICQAQHYKVKGVVVGLTSDSLIVIKMKGKNPTGEKIKVTAGRFEFEDSIKEPYFIQLIKLKRGSSLTDGKLTEFMVEAGEIDISGNAADFDSVKVAGSKSDDILKKYLKEDLRLLDKWNELKMKYDVSVKNKDSINRKSLGIALNRITFNDRIPLLKKYVQSNRNNVVGALIPNFCSLEDVLRKEDYLEMFNLLTEEMKQTDYAKSTYSRSKD